MNPLPVDIVDVVWRASALLTAAGLVDAVLRRRGSAAARCLVWSIAMAGLLVLPIASYALPPWAVRIPVARGTVASTDRAGAVAPAASAEITAASTGSLAAVAAGPRTAAEDRSDGPGSALTIALAALYALYAGGALVLMVRFFREPLVLRRLTRASREVDDPAWRRLFDQAARQSGVGRPVRLLQSAGELMPMTYGTWRPALVLPASADDWSDDRRHAVLLHELAHVARRDCFVQRVASLACALYWPHPGVWWAARRLRTERELACDDLVLAAGAAPREYAGHLLDLARSLGSVPAPATALGMARARQLETRLLAVLDAARNRAGLRRGRLALTIGLSIAVLLPIAALRAAVVPIDPAAAQNLAPLVAGGPMAFLSQVTSASPDLTGTWELRPAREPGYVEVSMRNGRSSHGRTVSIAQLEALTGTRVVGTNGPVHFPIRREAGTFTIDGVCRGGVCGGTYAFEPNPGFPAELAKRGIGAPTAKEQFELAIMDVGLAWLDELSANGYEKPDIRGMVRAAEHGVSLDYVRSMASLGYRVGTVEALVQLRDHGVDPDYVRGMQQAGYRLGLDDLTRTRDHGVDPDYVRGLSTLGYAGLTVETLVKARDHGVDPEYIRGLAALGYKAVPLDSLIRMRDHGVDPEYVRRLQQRGNGRLSVDELIQRRDRGEDNSDAAAREMAASLRVLWHSIVTHVTRVARLRG